MIGNFYTLRAIALSLSPLLEGKSLTGAFSQEKDELVLELEHGTMHLVLSCRQGELTCFLHPAFARARKNSTDVLEGCYPDRITHVGLHHADRILSIDLSRGLTLVFLPFTGKSNVLLIDSGGKIVNAFRNARSLIGTVFAQRTGELVHDVHRLLEEGAAHPDQPLLQLLRASDPLLGRRASLELLCRSGIQENALFSSLTPEVLDRLVSAYVEILGELTRPEPRVYWDERDTPLALSIIPLRHLAGAREERFTDIHTAIRSFIYRSRSASALRDHRQVLIEGLSRWIKRTRRSATAIEQELLTHGRSETYERYGAMLLAHLDNVPQGSSAISLPSQEGPAVIPLDPKLSPSANAQRYYERAKRARRAATESGARLQALRARLLRAELLEDALKSAVTKQSLEALMKERRAEFDAFGIGPRSSERQELPFRVFTVDGGLQVLAGKNSENNDLLTLRYARPNDLWFHARGSGGSHVVLRVPSASTHVTKKAKEQAAAIAAYYSRMRKAKLVPVAMTEKKYVRKPKGAPAGTVTLQREEVLFATPALPPGPPEP